MDARLPARLPDHRATRSPCRSGGRCGDYVSRTARAPAHRCSRALRLRVGDRPGAPDEALGALDQLLGYGALATLAGVSQAGAFLETVLASRPRNRRERFAFSTPWRRTRDALLDRPARGRPGAPSRLVRDRSHARNAARLRCLRLLTDPRGFDAHRRLRLSRVAAPERRVARTALDSGYLRGLYDLGFAYEDGDPARPRVARRRRRCAGFVRAFFTYRGAFFWKMQGGMGDVVFAPLYEVLRRRGVRFALLPSTDRRCGVARGEAPHVAALDFDVQAKPMEASMQPLVDVRGMPLLAVGAARGPARGWRAHHAREGWDFESHWDRRRAGTATLRVERDFDFVVLGVGLGAIPHVCADILERDARWRAMVDARADRRDASLPGLARRRHRRRSGGRTDRSTLSGFVEPFDTWADMHHLVRHEAWPRPPQGARATSVACCPTPARHATLSEQRERVRRNAIRFLRPRRPPSLAERDHRVRRLPLGAARGPAGRRRAARGAARRVSRPSSGPRT